MDRGLRNNLAVFGRKTPPNLLTGQQLKHPLKYNPLYRVPASLMGGKVQQTFNCHAPHSSQMLRCWAPQHYQEPHDLHH